MEWVFIIFNKVNSEWGGYPINYFDAKELSEIFSFLENKFNLIYCHHNLFEIDKKQYSEDHDETPNRHHIYKRIKSKIIKRKIDSINSDIISLLDIAANNFYDSSFYKFNRKKNITADELLDNYIIWLKKYPIISIEDPFSENDILFFKKLINKAPEYVQIIGDDLVVTNKELISKAAYKKSINSVLIKPNQIGTISETLDALQLTRDLGLVEIISARSGETEDVTIADLSVGWQTNQIKVGSFSRSERLAKWNQCLRIGEQIKNDFLMQKNTVLKWDRL